MQKLFFKAVLLLFAVSFFSCTKPGDLKVQRAMKSFAAEDYDDALALFNEALNEESHYSPELIYNFMANIYLQTDDLENALIYQEKVCESRPEYRDLVSLGMTYHLLNRDEEAESAYKKAIDYDSNKAEAYASLGALFLGQGKYEKALENLKKAAEIEDKIAIIHANLAVAYAANGNSEKSEAEFKIAEDLKCKNLEEFRERAEVLKK